MNYHDNVFGLGGLDLLHAATAAQQVELLPIDTQTHNINLVADLDMWSWGRLRVSDELSLQDQFTVSTEPGYLHVE